MIDQINNCRVVREIGSGGMAVVYQAEQEALDRTVAIKALKPSIAMDSQFAERFEREAHFMASLAHENILNVYDFVKDRHSMYIIMEYIEGIDLYDLIEISPVFPPEVAAIIVLQVARALDYAHFRGVIHRDIKPANIMLSKFGDVKLMDFGIARNDAYKDLTQTGTGLGTPSYMSPEQILGDRLDFRSDLFSVGIVFYQLVTGRKPFIEDDSRTVMQKIRLDRFISPKKLNPKVPRAVDRIISRCLEKNASDRYPTTQALIDELNEFLAPRVPMNHHARLVMYLRDISVLSDNEASGILEASGSRRETFSYWDRRLFTHVGIAQLLAFVGIVVTAISLHLSDGGIEIPQALTFPSEDVHQTTEEPGYLKFVVEPWAEVSVNGVARVTTPHAERIAVSPGEHFVRFKNPYFETVTQQIQVESGEIKTIRVQLESIAEKDKAKGKKK